MADNGSYSAAAVVAMARGVVRLPSNVKHKASSVVQQLGYVSTQLLQIRTCHSIKHTYSYFNSHSGSRSHHSTQTGGCL